ncbi:hypothetical protein [Nocardioides taihuensis]|uniref:Uncharacterized protein n=1 Tax=Nocardioides taihuensis TaxID=1835606 RepID=A0ABW0BLE4_9ACTN
MSQQDTTRQTPVQFPPIPLLSGDTVEGSDGPARLRSVTVCITLDDGSRMDIDLESRFGGWWAPTGASTSAAAEG